MRRSGGHYGPDRLGSPSRCSQAMIQAGSRTAASTTALFAPSRMVEPNSRIFGSPRSVSAGSSTTTARDRGGEPALTGLVEWATDSCSPRGPLGLRSGEVAQSSLTNRMDLVAATA